MMELATRIQAINGKAVHVGCNSHILNLCKVQLVRNVMANVHVVADFFNNSLKRFDLVTKKVEELLAQVCHSHLGCFI